MRRVSAVVMLLVSASAFAQDKAPPPPLANQQLADPAKEAAATALMHSVRCVVCQGQSIADSDAEMAASMRALIRERIAAGEKPEAIRAWLIERYGAFVSYKPVFDAATAPLWIAPIALLVAGAWLARGRMRRRGWTRRRG